MNTATKGSKQASRLAITIPPPGVKPPVSTMRLTRDDLINIRDLEKASDRHSKSAIVSWALDRAIKSLRRKK